MLEAVQKGSGYAVSDQDGFSRVMHGDRDAKGDSDSSLAMPAYLRYRSGTHTTPQRASCDELYDKTCHVRFVTVTCFTQRNMAPISSQRHSLRMYLAWSVDLRYLTRKRGAKHSQSLARRANARQRETPVTACPDACLVNSPGPPGAHVHFHTDRGQDQGDEKAGACARTVDH